MCLLCTLICVYIVWVCSFPRVRYLCTLYFYMFRCVLIYICCFCCCCLFYFFLCQQKRNEIILFLGDFFLSISQEKIWWDITIGMLLYTVWPFPTFQDSILWQKKILLFEMCESRRLHFYLGGFKCECAIKSVFGWKFINRLLWCKKRLSLHFFYHPCWGIKSQTEKNNITIKKNYTGEL